MDLSGIPQPSMDWQASNLPDAWKKFRSHVDLIFKGPLQGKDETIQVSYLLLWIGEKGREIHDTWTISETDRKKLSTFYDRFQAYVQPKLNPIFARYKFNQEVQGSNTIETFVTKLKVLVKDCDYKEPDQMVRDRIVFGTSSDRIREKLINLGDKLTLDLAIQTAQNYEYSQSQLKLMSKPEEQQVHFVSKNQHRSKGGNRNRTTSNFNSDRPIQRGYFVNRPIQRGSDGDRRQKQQPKCMNCGNKHGKYEKCPAKGKQCNFCKKWNHFAGVCRQQLRKRGVSEVCVDPDSNSNIDHSHFLSDNCEILYVDTDNDFNEFFIDSIDNNSKYMHDQAFATVEVGPQHKPIKFKLDTGSQVNIIPEHIFNKIGIKCVLRKSNIKLSTYNGHPLKIVGICNLTCSHAQYVQQLEFYVVNTTSLPILGLRSCLDFALIKFVHSVDTQSRVTQSHIRQPLDKPAVLREYADVFKGIGLFPAECDIVIDPKVLPVVNPPRRVPIALRDRLELELKSMEAQSIITKVTEPTQWVNSLVVVEKPASGKLRICLDPQNLNRAIQRPHYPTRNFEDVLPELSNAKYFTKLDARSGYWAIKLSTESSYLTTFNTPFGRFRYLRLPFGLKSSQDEFQRKIDECYEGLEGTVALVDDILVYGRSREEHDQNLRNVLNRSREKGVKLNSEKLEVGLTEVPYFGHLLSSDGLKPDPANVAAIRNMEAPRNRAELETILGMVNYLSKFAPNLAEITSPLRALLAKNVEFAWDEPQSKAFKMIKDILTQSPGPVLAYFDPKKDVTLQVDASKFGLGATLLQDGRPVAYASKSLTASEVNYAQIEKEMFAILFGCKRFHQYIYGRRVDVQTDHKPLEDILKKPLSAAPPRLQRMLLQVQRYDLHVYHVSGKNIPLADTLSRKYLPDTDPSLSQDMDVYVHSVMRRISISDRKLDEIRSETEKDPQLVKVQHAIRNGWSETWKECPVAIRDYWNFRDELTVEDGIVLKGTRVVVPNALRSALLENIHYGHMGVDKCLRRARDTVFWPRISNDINELVLNCSTCLDKRKSNQKEPLVSHVVPELPWQVLATDLFSWNNNDFLVVVDYYSRYFEVERLHSVTSTAVINKLKAIFSRHGIPLQLVSDNGPQYASREFSNFAKSWNFVHQTSSPLYPQSNGLAEKTVQTVKRIFAKAKSCGNDPYIS